MVPGETVRANRYKPKHEGFCLVIRRNFLTVKWWTRVPKDIV